MQFMLIFVFDVVMLVTFVLPDKCLMKCQLCLFGYLRHILPFLSVFVVYDLNRSLCRLNFEISEKITSMKFRVYCCTQAFEQAEKELGFVFPNQWDISVERIKQSNYFKALIQHSKGSTRIEVDECVKQEYTNVNVSKVHLHGKPRSLYGSLSGKNGRLDSNGVEGRGLSTFINVDEERTNGSSFQIETSSCGNQ